MGLGILEDRKLDHVPGTEPYGFDRIIYLLVYSLIAGKDLLIYTKMRGDGRKSKRKDTSRKTGLGA